MDKCTGDKPDTFAHAVPDAKFDVASCAEPSVKSRGRGANPMYERVTTGPDTFVHQELKCALHRVKDP